MDVTPPHPDDEEVIKVLAEHGELSEGQIVDATQRYGLRGSDAISDCLERCQRNGWIRKTPALAVPPFGLRPMYQVTRAAKAWLAAPDDAEWVQLRDRGE